MEGSLPDTVSRETGHAKSLEKTGVGVKEVMNTQLDGLPQVRVKG